MYLKAPRNNVNEIFGQGNAVVSGIKYKAAVLVDQQNSSAVVTINIGARDTSIIKTTDDIEVTLTVVDGSGKPSSVIQNPDCTKILNVSDGSAVINVTRRKVSGRYLITYTFIVQNPKCLLLLILHQLMAVSIL